VFLHLVANISDRFLKRRINIKLRVKLWKNGSLRSHRSDENVEKVRNPVHSDIRLSINQAFFVQILKRLLEIVRKKRPEHSPGNWFLQHDHAAAHKAVSVKQFLARKPITEMEHRPYSPDLASNDFGCLQN